jgi:hypothetical protein
LVWVYLPPNLRAKLFGQRAFDGFHHFVHLFIVEGGFAGFELEADGVAFLAGAKLVFVLVYIEEVDFGVGLSSFTPLPLPPQHSLRIQIIAPTGAADEETFVVAIIPVLLVFTQDAAYVLSFAPVIGEDRGGNFADDLQEIGDHKALAGERISEVENIEPQGIKQIGDEELHTAWVDHVLPPVVHRIPNLGSEA